MDDFTLKLQSQFWIDKNPDNTTDYCSHGNVVFKINEMTFLDGEDDTRKVVSAALRLMMSALRDYSSDSDLELIPCCGALMGPGCPTFLTYNTSISEKAVTITRIINSYNRVDGESIIDGPFIIDKVDYIKQVLSFARKVKAFYAKSKLREFIDEYDKNEYERFWRDFENCYTILKKTICTVDEGI